jgi:hypothetical protein
MWDRLRITTRDSKYTLALFAFCSLPFPSPSTTHTLLYLFTHLKVKPLQTSFPFVYRVIDVGVNNGKVARFIFKVLDQVHLPLS